MLWSFSNTSLFLAIVCGCFMVVLTCFLVFLEDGGISYLIFTFPASQPHLDLLASSSSSSSSSSSISSASIHDNTSLFSLSLRISLHMLVFLSSLLPLISFFPHLAVFLSLSFIFRPGASLTLILCPASLLALPSSCLITLCTHPSLPANLVSFHLPLFLLNARYVCSECPPLLILTVLILRFITCSLFTLSVFVCLSLCNVRFVSLCVCFVYFL